MLVSQSALGFCLGLLISFCLFLTPSSVNAFFTANTLGDFDDVAVVEVSGDYNALIDGVWNHEARKVLAREFYRTHGDDYDFLVIFTNFDFDLPEVDAAAYFTPVQNQVQGIGLDTFDDSTNYSIDGQPLERLQGTIDMANLSGYVTDPTDPGFETTLKILAHELSHRWGAYVHFIDEQGQQSDALLGIADAHWSFLLDSEGSTLYGNNWQDNGDGTFTSMPPEQGQEGFNFGRIFSPLDLYLMGVLAPNEVPPMTLLESPGVAADLPPVVGETIVATAKTVTIDQVVAAEGVRHPSAADAQAEWRIGYIYAVVPGSWNAASAEARVETAAIATVGQEWSQRFSLLTDGSAMMQSGFPETPDVDENPGLSLPVTTPALVPSLNDGVTWLITQQQPEGFWWDRDGLEPCTTALAVAALEPFPAGVASALQGTAWLDAQAIATPDFLARALLATHGSDAENLLNQQNPDGGWGGCTGYQSTPMDTSLVLQALAASQSPASVQIADAVTYLTARQNLDGGWPSGHGQSMLQPTANALLALRSFRGDGQVQTALDNGLAWLQEQQDADGGFGDSRSTAYDTATALLALKTLGAPQDSVDSAVAYLLNSQTDTGSWQESVFQTASAVQALYLGQVATDLKVHDADIVLSPSPIDVVPADASLSARIWNLGEADLSAVEVCLHEGEDDSLPAVQGQFVDLPGHSSVVVNFPLHVDLAGRCAYTVSVDPDRIIEEVSDQNNRATYRFYAGLQPPAVQFQSASSNGSEALTTVEVIVALSHAWEEPVSVDYTATAAGTSEVAVDFTLESGTLVIPAGETSGTITLTILNDQFVESDETVQVQISNPQNGSLGTDLFTYTILDDDLLPTVAITSPVDGQTYFDRTLYFAYTSNMSSDKISAYVDGKSISSGSGYTLSPLPYGTHTIQVDAVNVNGVIASDEVTFFVDDTGLPLDVVWHKDGYGYLQFEVGEDGGFYGRNSFAKFDQAWTKQWSIAETVTDFCLKGGKLYVIQQDRDVSYQIRVYEPGGSLLWAKTSPVGWGRVVVDDAGNVIVAGNTWVDMGKNKPQQSDIVVHKFDSYGRHLWKHQLGTDLDETLADLGVDDAGNIYAAGTTSGYIATDEGGENVGARDVFVAKISPGQETVTIRQFGTDLDDEANEMRTDSQNNIYLAATTRGSFDGVPLVYDKEAALIKLNDQFGLEWIKQEHQLNRSVNLSIDQHDAVYLGGTYGEYAPNRYNTYTVRVFKYNSAGEQEWVLNAFDQYYNQKLYELHVDSSGSLHMSAYYLYPNYSTGYWEYRTFLRKYGTGAEEDPPPVLTLNPVASGLDSTALSLSGTRENGADVEVSDASSSMVGAVVYPTATTWSCELTGLAEGAHALTVSTVGAHGQPGQITTNYRVYPGARYRQEWATQYGTASHDYNRALSFDGNGQLLVLGQTDGVYDTDLIQSHDDLLIAHVSSDGTMAHTPWQMDLRAGETDDDALDAVMDAAGNSYLLWKAYWLSGYVSKLDPNGVELWRTTINSKNTNHPVAITLDPAGNIYVCGYTQFSISREPYGGEWDYFVAKYDSNGEELWVRLSGEPGTLYGDDIAVGPGGSVWVLGREADGYGHDLGLLFKYSSDGTLLGQAVVEPHDGTVATVQATTDGVYVAGTANYMDGAGSVPYLVKFDTALNRIWQNTLTSLAMTANDLVVTANGEIAIAGTREGDSQILLIDALGQVTSSEKIFTSQSDAARGIVAGPDGSLYLSGQTYGSLGGEANGGEDTFVVKLQQLSGPALEIFPYLSPTRESSQVVSGSVSAGATINVSVIAPADSPTTISPVTVNSDGSWSFNVDGLVSNDDNVLTVAATNEIGTTSGILTITVDTLPPTLSIDDVTSPMDQDDQLITGHIEEGALLTVTVNSATTSEVVPVTSGVWSYMATSLLEGDNLLCFTATDAAGNHLSKTVTLTYLPPPPMSAALLPALIPENMSADVMLSVANLRPIGGTIEVEQQLDLNRNEVADAGEPVVRRFTLTDGLIDSDQNVPSDSDGLANGVIEARLSYQLVNDRFHAPAACLFRVAGDNSSTAAVFEVEEVSEMQAISGQVTDALGQPLQGAFVALTDSWGRSYGYAVSNDIGQYWLQVETPGEYRVVPLAEGYHFDLDHSAALSLLAGQVLTSTDLQLQSGSHHFAGQVVDEGTGLGIPGLLVRAADNAGAMAAGLTAADGSYSLLLPAGTFEVSVNAIAGAGPSGKGYLVPESPLLAVEVGADSSDNEIPLVAADGLIAGRVLDAAGLPIDGVPVQASCVDECGTAYGESNALGDYTLGVRTGHLWRVSLLDDVAQPLGLVGPDLPELEATSTLTMAPDLTVTPVDGWIEGLVSDEVGNPVANVTIQAVNSVTESLVVTRTNRDGRYRLGIDAGPCLVDVSAGSAGYDLPEPVEVVVTSGQVVVEDFLLTQVSLANTIEVSSAVYNIRKSTLTVTASSTNPDAQLILEGYGPMTMTKALKGVYTWVFSESVATAPATVTVSGPEGSATVSVSLK